MAMPSTLKQLATKEKKRQPEDTTNLTDTQQVVSDFAQQMQQEQQHLDTTASTNPRQRAMATGAAPAIQSQPNQDINMREPGQEQTQEQPQQQKPDGRQIVQKYTSPQKQQTTSLEKLFQKMGQQQPATQNEQEPGQIQQAIDEASQMRDVAMAGKIGSEIGAGIGGAITGTYQEPQTGAFEAIEERAAQIPSEERAKLQAQAKEQKQNPDSAISQYYRDYYRKMGVDIPEDVSASQIQEMNIQTPEPPEEEMLTVSRMGEKWHASYNPETGKLDYVAKAEPSEKKDIKGFSEKEKEAAYDALDRVTDRNKYKQTKATLSATNTAQRLMDLQEEMDNKTAISNIRAEIAKMYESGRLTDEDVLRYTRSTDLASKFKNTMELGIGEGWTDKRIKEINEIVETVQEEARRSMRDMYSTEAERVSKAEGMPKEKMYKFLDPKGKYREVSPEAKELMQKAQAQGKQLTRSEAEQIIKNRKQAAGENE